MVTRRKIERFPGPRISGEAQAHAHAHAHSETRPGRSPTIISEAISGVCSSPGAPSAEDDADTQTGHVRHSDGDRPRASPSDGENETAATPASRNEASQGD